MTIRRLPDATPVDPALAEDYIRLYRGVERLESNRRNGIVIDAAAAYVAKVRYGIGAEDPIRLLDHLEAALVGTE